MGGSDQLDRSEKLLRFGGLLQKVYKKIFPNSFIVAQAIKKECKVQMVGRVPKEYGRIKEEADHSSNTYPTRR